jgi:pimeloyl-ACP methyl ester carboxylesterase
MQNPRKYGSPPYGTAVIHGGPGAAGEMAPVARALSLSCGVLEPMQTKTSVLGQVVELHELFSRHANVPVTLAGYSWGAWLSVIYAAEQPSMVKKLILISSGPFEQGYATAIQAERMKRLGKKEIDEIEFLMDALENPAARNKDKIFTRIGEIMSKTGIYKPVDDTGEKIELNGNIYKSVWKEAEDLRKSGKLMDYVKKIKCPVIAIHGDFDPHPAEGVEKPLSKVLKDFRFILLKNCGHTPWMEKLARDEFYKILKAEIITNNQ